MKAKELIERISKLPDDAEVDFLLIGDLPCFLNLCYVNMNEDIDDPENQHRGGIVFSIKEYL